MSKPSGATPPTTPRDPGSAFAIEVRDLVHRYRDRTALNGVSFSVREGEIFGVLGPNGGGKSTLFRIISTMITPTGGELLLFGRDPRRQITDARRDLGVVFQSPSIDLMLTARENLLHHGHLYRLHGRALRDRVAALLDRVGLRDRANDRVSAFSGGMRRRLEIAKSLLHHPRLLILDEPSTGLDPGARRDMWNDLRRLREDEGVTLVFTTHLMDEAEGCDRLALLDRGNLVALDTPAALKELVGGDVITVETAEPATLASEIAVSLEVEAAVVGDRVRIERDRGHEFVTRLVEAFPGRIRSVAVGEPTLEDVFIDITGRRFAEAEAEAEAARPRPRRGRGRAK